MQGSLLDVLVHLFMTAMLAAALCVASIVVAGSLALAVWILGRAGHAIAGHARSFRIAHPRRDPGPRGLPLPAFRHRLRRP